MDVKKIMRAKNSGLHGEINILGDKSVSHRSVMLSSLVDGESVRIKNFLRAQDCMSTVHCIQSLGVEINEVGEDLEVHGVGLHGFSEPKDILDAGNSGTTLRLMMGLLSSQNFLTVFTGDSSLRRRPMNRVINPLKQMGSNIFGRNNDKLLPIVILPSKNSLHDIAYKMPVASAQVKSAILLAGLMSQIDTTLFELMPTRDHTERMLRGFGAEIFQEGTKISLKAAKKLHAPEILEVPGDISSATFWLVAASIVPNSDLLLKNVGINPTRTGSLDILKKMGADITEENLHESGGEPMADLRVRSAKLHGVSFGGEMIPRLVDEIPVLSVAAMFADGDTKISDAGELRVKETDRLSAISTEFNKLTKIPCIEEFEDTLLIHGNAQPKSATCSSYGDHRIAMSLAILGLAGDGVEIEDPNCVNISYPEFFTILENL